MPAATIRSIYDDCVEKGQSPYDLFGSLLRQMNDPGAAEAGCIQRSNQLNSINFNWT